MPVRIVALLAKDDVLTIFTEDDVVTIFPAACSRFVNVVPVGVYGGEYERIFITGPAVYLRNA